MAQRKMPSHDLTAAYSASQPLFDALRLATSKLEQQNTRLATAKDIVQQLHVKIPSVDSDGLEKHEHYMDCVVRAWQSTTEAYTDILVALANVTAASPAEAKEAMEGHGHFRAMAEDAYRARGNATQYLEAMAVRIPTTPFQSKQPFGTTDTADSKDLHRKFAKLLRTKTKGGSGVNSPRGQAVQERREARNVKRKQRRMKDSKEAGTTSTDKGSQGPTEAEDTRPDNGVQYEDVSAEVEARLKAKEAQKLAKKLETKRKRQSNDSAMSIELAGSTRKRAKAEELLEDGGEKPGEKHRTEGEASERQKNKRRKCST